MPFKPGESGNITGRPKGSPNIAGMEAKEMLSTFSTKEFKRLAKGFEDSKMSDFQKWTVLFKIFEFILPKLRSQELEVGIELSDQQSGKILAELITKYAENHEVRIGEITK